MSPTLSWGLGAGLVIAVVDALTVFVSANAGPAAEMVQLVDLLANIAILSFVGLRVGRTTGVVRAAAEAGVIAGVIAGLAGLAVLYLTRPGPPPTAMEIVQGLALNVAMGGVIAWLNGFFGARARQAGPGPSRRR
ncbi:MAG: hypothetical protein M3O34_13335 [Chloroflexota bacterium]|nr:hypothetical protein [Chloroflexota bacterium]